MVFYLEIESVFGPDLKVILDEGNGLPATTRPNTLYLSKGRQRMVSFECGPDKRVILLGDPVFTAQESLFCELVSEDGRMDEGRLYENIKGHYYWFLHHKNGLRCGSSFGAIYPIYYYEGIERSAISSSSFYLAGKTGAEPGNRRNLLERLLFNYPFFGSTWWKDIQLLDSHRHLHLTGHRIGVEGNFQLERYFGSPEHRSRARLDDLAALFQEESNAFFPDEPFAVSLTGGFDGRTLVAAARRAGKNFFTYSFGRPDAPDVVNPAKQSKALGIPYQPVLLDEAYLSGQAWDSAQAFMQLTEYNGNLGRPHYHFAAQTLSEKTRYMVTGNFGSELFRALHEPGVMISQSLIDVFSAKDDSWKDALAREISRWGDGWKEAEESLMEDLSAYLNAGAGQDANHRFYQFVFGEIFRKYFGPELVMQSHYLNNRTPYLNLAFFKALNQTIWSGVHSRLFEQLKSRRMKGQLFYASFLRQADKKLYQMPTTKGYTPADVLELWRMPLLVGGVALQKYLKKEFYDDNGVEAFFGKRAEALDDLIRARGGDTATLERLLKPEPHMEKRIKQFSIALGWASTAEAFVPSPL